MSAKMVRNLPPTERQVSSLLPVVLNWRGVRNQQLWQSAGQQAKAYLNLRDLYLNEGF